MISWKYRTGNSEHSKHGIPNLIHCNLNIQDTENAPWTHQTYYPEQIILGHTQQSVRSVKLSPRYVKLWYSKRTTRLSVTILKHTKWPHF